MTELEQRLGAVPVPTVPPPGDGPAKARAAGERRRQRTRATRGAAGVATVLLVMAALGAVLARPDSESVRVGGPDGSASDGTGPSGATGTWAKVASLGGSPFKAGNGPSPAFWTGSELVVLGASDGETNRIGPSFVVNPTTGAVRTAPAPTTVGSDEYGLRATWTGSAFVLLGADLTVGAPTEFNRRSAMEAYEPSTDRWRTVPLPTPGIRSIGGGGGYLFALALAGGALWQTDEGLANWQQVTLPEVAGPDANRSSLAWDGTELVLVPSAPENVTLAFDPRSGRWRERGAGAVSSGDSAPVIGSAGGDTPADGLVVAAPKRERAAVLATRGSGWVEFGPTERPQRQFLSSIVGGHRLWRWGGREWDFSPASTPPRSVTGGEIVDLRTGASEPMPAFPNTFYGIGGAWTGSELLVYGAEIAPGTNLDSPDVRPTGWAVYRLVPGRAVVNPTGGDASRGRSAPGGAPSTTSDATSSATGAPTPPRADCATGFGAGRPDEVAYAARLSAVVDVVAGRERIACARDVSTAAGPALILDVADGRSMDVRAADVRGRAAVTASWQASTSVDPASLAEARVDGARTGFVALTALAREGNAVTAWATDGNNPSAEVQVNLVGPGVASEPGARERVATIAADLVRSSPSTWRLVPIVLAVPPWSTSAAKPSTTTRMAAMVQGTLAVDMVGSASCVRLDGQPIVFGTGATWSIDEQGVLLPGGAVVRPGETFESGGGNLKIHNLARALASAAGVTDSGESPGDGPWWTVANDARRCLDSAGSGEVPYVG